VNFIICALNCSARELSWPGNATLHGGVRLQETMRVPHFLRFSIGIVILTAGTAAAQGPSWDSSGNKLLSGDYYFREVIYIVSDTAGDVNRALSFYGNIHFDGLGIYSIQNAFLLDSNSSGLQPITANGTYSVAASGFGFFSHPLSSGSSSYTVYGLVANGIFIGSSTEAGFNDMFVAAPVGSPVATNSSFQGSYSLVGFLPGGTPADMADTMLQLNPDGAGNLGTVNVKGYYGGNGSSALTQTSAAVKYAFSNGAANVTFPDSNTAPFYAGSEYLYISPDGNFVFGGSPQGYDIFVGVKTPPSGVTQNLSGLYYEAGLDEDASQLAQGFGNLDSYYGSFIVLGQAVVGHERLLSLFNASAEGFTFSNSLPASIPGTYTDTSGTTQYVVGNGGTIRVGFGIGPYLGINVALQAPAIPGPGDATPFLNPTGITNAASSAPFTAGISSGELITLYGSNLASGNAVASSLPWPTTLNGVQVTVNGLPAPIYYVSSGQVSAVVPYGTTFGIGQIQVVNKGAASNMVTEFIQTTTPGIFTLTANGLGYGAIEHADGSLVSTTSPAQIGETVALYTSGLGQVFPQVPEGTPGPTDPLSKATNNITAKIGGIAATVTYAGLAPYLAGVYQVNVTIPSGVPAGDSGLDIAGPDSYTAEAVIPIGSASTSAATAASTAATNALAGTDASPLTSVFAVPRGRARRMNRPESLGTRTAPCFSIDRGCRNDR
jgi:uncharacterized protein (TIGR03437 family)